MIHEIPCHLVTDSSDNTCMAVFTKNWSWTNSTTGMTWKFKKGDTSDGHSTGSYFRHFDDVTIAALCHDQDCVKANKDKSYQKRKRGDRSYKWNMINLKASKGKVYRRYAAVSAYARWLKMKGDLK